jgi:hypothetical protein
VKSYKGPALQKISFQSLVKNVATPAKLPLGSLTKLTGLNSTGLKSSLNDPVLKGISFGSPSSRGSSRTQAGTSGSGFASLLGAGNSSLLGGVSSGLLGGLSIGQLLSGALGLLGLGSSSKTLPPLQRFTLPDPQQVVAALPSSPKLLPVQTTMRSGSSSTTTAASQTRAVSPQTAVGRGSSTGLSSSTSGPAGQLATSGHQVHVHVSALDTQSFMDRSNDIAKAVKNAMLQSSSLNDVISEI